MKKELFYYPVLFLYLEIVFHFYMGLDMKYFPVFGGFALAMGMFFCVINYLLPCKAGKVVRGVISLLISVLFCVEVICRDILQQYFQLFSAVDTAMGNRLEDYSNAIIESLLKNAGGIALLLAVPAVFYSVVTVRTKIYKRQISKMIRNTVILSIICVALHFATLGVMRWIPWNGDFTPEKLYKMDTNVDDQVEQLGLITMLRLDMQHFILGTSAEVDIDLDDLTGSDSSEDVAEEIIEEIVYEPNVMELDLAALAANTGNDNVKWLAEYLQTVTPTMQNEYTGMFEGYNVIFITAEGFSGYMIDPEVTPTLYKLANEGFVFRNFYTALHFTSTSGGEFQNLTGLYPKNGFPISMKESGIQRTYLPFTLANALNQEGYTSIGYHFNENMYGRELSHPNLGYDWRQASDCVNPVVKEKDENGDTIWPQSDDYMVEQSIQDYIGQEPFNIYYLTLSGHLPYGYGSSRMSARNRELVEALPYSEKTKAYIAANLELEKGLTRLITELENAGIADRTLIVMAPDHIPYSDLDVLAELAGHSFGSDSLESLNEQSIDFEVYKSSLIIWSASMSESEQAAAEDDEATIEATIGATGKGTIGETAKKAIGTLGNENAKGPIYVDKTCCQVDILPTVLNLLGVTYDSRLLAGTDILSDSEGLVIFSSNSWMTDKGLYNRFTGEFTLKDAVAMSEEEIQNYVSRMKTTVSCKMAMTSIIIENDFYSLLMN